MQNQNGDIMDEVAAIFNNADEVLAKNDALALA